MLHLLPVQPVRAHIWAVWFAPYRSSIRFGYFVSFLTKISQNSFESLTHAKQCACSPSLKKITSKTVVFSNSGGGEIRRQKLIRWRSWVSPARVRCFDALSRASHIAHLSNLRVNQSSLLHSSCTNKICAHKGHYFVLAEEGRFELPRAFTLAVFKTAALDQLCDSSKYFLYKNALL